MLLRESGEQANQAYNVDAVTQSDGDAGVPHGDYLRRLVEATIRGEWISLAQLRGDAEAAMGTQQVVDALAVAAAFNGITRVADATGIPLDEEAAQATESMRQATGIDQFAYHSKSQRYD